jgi:hypothetical protein
VRPIVIALVLVSGSVGALAQKRSASTTLLNPAEREWFAHLPKAQQALELKALRAAQLCIARYASKNGKEDAKSAAKLPEAKFLSGTSNGVVVYRTAPGLDGCSGPSLNLTDDNFVQLSDAWSGPPNSLGLQVKCSTMANRYAADFNQTLATERPEVLHRACPDSTNRE